ncbi:MAG TPA: hypothetical protein P5218_14090 [Planctomycetota bacterium]|nr:hypothetical protein [Planctomycetota bacterium]HPF13767.1 hypothetical protein [Planctomycetota bacterium]HRV82563.1 hypothetical protein [Planctomycetota bacterium]
MLRPSRVAFLSFLLAACFLTACGGGGHEAVAKEMSSVMSDLTESLSKVKDVDSAKQQKSRLESLSKKMADLSAKMDKLGPPDEKTTAKLAKMAPGEAEQGKMFSEMMRIASLPQEVQQIIQPALEKMGGQ